MFSRIAMLIGDAQMSSSDGTQALALQQVSILLAAIYSTCIYEHIASGRRDDWPGLVACLTPGLHRKTLPTLKRLDKLVAEGGGPLSNVLAGHSKLKKDLRRLRLHKFGGRMIVSKFGDLRDPRRDLIDWMLNASLDEGVVPGDMPIEESVTLLAGKLKTLPQICHHLLRALDVGFKICVEPIYAGIVETVSSIHLTDLEPQPTCNGSDLRNLVEQFDAKPAEICRRFSGDLTAGHSPELTDELRTNSLPT